MLVTRAAGAAESACLRVAVGVRRWQVQPYSTRSFCVDVLVVPSGIRMPSGRRIVPDCLPCWQVHAVVHPGQRCCGVHRMSRGNLQQRGGGDFSHRV